MAAAALALGGRSDDLLPRAPGGMGAGAMLALLVHGALVAALTTVVQWRSQDPAPVVMSAELWASVPQIETPPPPPPVPVPVQAPAVAPATPQPDADIATERARKRQAEADALKEKERRKAEAARAEHERAQAERKLREQEAREAKADAARLEAQREANLRRMLGQAGSAPGGATAQTPGSPGTAPSAAYSGRLAALIRPHIVFTGTLPGNPAAEVEVRAAAGGSVISSRLVKSSGHKAWDEAVLRAIERTPVLPRDGDGRVPPTLIISFTPRE
jgi:colicin import membrane protein